MRSLSRCPRPNCGGRILIEGGHAYCDLCSREFTSQVVPALQVESPNDLGRMALTHLTALGRQIEELRGDLAELVSEAERYARVVEASGMALPSELGGMLGRPKPAPKRARVARSL